MTKLIEMKTVARGTTDSRRSIGPFQNMDIAVPLTGEGHAQETHVVIVVEMSRAQYDGVCEYLAAIKAGMTTSTVEEALTALTP